MPDIEITMVDERYTTTSSAEELEMMNVPKDEQKAYIDQLAACMILEEYMNNQQNTN